MKTKRISIDQFLALIHVCRLDLTELKGEQPREWAIGYWSALDRVESYLRGIGK